MTWHLKVDLFDTSSQTAKVKHLDFREKTVVDAQLKDLNKIQDWTAILTNVYHIENENKDSIHFFGSEYKGHELKEDHLGDDGD
jgi:hypothetical protein